MFLKTPEAAKYLRLSEAFLEKARTYGGGPKFAKLGRVVVYRREDLDSWVASRVQDSTSAGAA